MVAAHTVAHRLRLCKMNGLFFYIGLGARPRRRLRLAPLPAVLLAGALGSAGALGVGFTRPLRFPEAGWWLLVVAVVFVLRLRCCSLCASTQERFQARRSHPRSSPATRLAAGALLFAGTLAAHGDAWWPGLIGGIAAAALGPARVGPVVLGARSRLPDRAAREALTVYLDAAALLLAGARRAAAPARLRAAGLLAVAARAHPCARRREVRRACASCAASPVGARQRPSSSCA